MKRGFKDRKHQMTAKTLLPILAAAMAATTAEALSVTETPKAAAKEHKVGGQSAVLTDSAWKRCGIIESLEYRDESVVPETLSHDEPLYRISLRNLLPVRRTFTVTAVDVHASETKRTVSVEPMSTVTATLPLAMAYEHSHSRGNTVSIMEDNPPASARPNGRGYETLVPANRPSEYYDQRSRTCPSLLLSDGITRDSIMPSFKNDYDTVELRRSAEDWPRDFRAYLPFDAVCIAEGAEKAFTPETRSALRAYELLGGAVVKMKDGASHPKDLEGRTNASRVRRTGDLKILSYYGYSHGYSNYGNKFSDNIAKVPMKVGRSLPIGFLVGILALVAIVAAPIAVWYCARKNRRLLLLAVLPGSALVLTVAVAAVALVAYGTTPTVRVQAVTILDPESHLAVTRGQFAVFSPVPVTGKMSIPPDASFRLRGRGTSSLLEVACEDSLRLKGEWVKPLSAAFFDFERAERRSERLDVRRGADGNVTVANLLGSPVACGSLQLGGYRYRIPSLAPGEQAPAEKLSRTQSIANGRKPADELAKAFFSESADYGRNWSKAPMASDDDKRLFPDGTYVVRLVGSPFFPSPLAGTESYETAESVVAGCIMAESGKEASK